LCWERPGQLTLYARAALECQPREQPALPVCILCPGTPGLSDVPAPNAVAAVRLRDATRRATSPCTRACCLPPCKPTTLVASIYAPTRQRLGPDCPTAVPTGRPRQAASGHGWPIWAQSQAPPTHVPPPVSVALSAPPAPEATRNITPRLPWATCDGPSAHAGQPPADRRLQHVQARQSLSTCLPLASPTADLRLVRLASHAHEGLAAEARLPWRKRPRPPTPKKGSVLTKTAASDESHAQQLHSGPGLADDHPPGGRRLADGRTDRQTSGRRTPGPADVWQTAGGRVADDRPTAGRRVADGGPGPADDRQTPATRPAEERQRNGRRLADGSVTDRSRACVWCPAPPPAMCSRLPPARRQTSGR
jgi:hypothetical protein